MIIDRTKIKPKTTIMDDALWVVEQVPTLVVSGDQTNILRAGKNQVCLYVCLFIHLCIYLFCFIVFCNTVVYGGKIVW